MLKINTIKRTFVRQSTEDDCGTACLAMLLNYMGRSVDAAKVSRLDVAPGGLSLKDLQTLAGAANLTSRCVEMELEFLKKLKKPVILHTVNELGQNHFQVCYGFRKSYRGNKFLMADPAIQVHYITESELANIWVSRAALYFESLDFNAEKKPSLLDLLRQRYYPIGLLIIVPLLSLCVASFSVALTWLLQKGLTNADILKGHIIYCLLVLLAIICLFKNLFFFLRQYIMVQINMVTNSKLMDQVVTKVTKLGRSKQPGIGDEVKIRFLNVQKMQNAISSFIAIVLSDGCMVIILLTSSLYLLPIAGFINIVYILTVIFLELRSLPELVYQTNKAKMLSIASENALINNLKQQDIDLTEGGIANGFNLFYDRNLMFAKTLAIEISKKYLLLECFGTLSLIVIIALTIFHFDVQEIDYGSLMLIVIEAYLITVLMQKICTAFQQLAEGTDALIAHFRE